MLGAQPGLALAMPGMIFSRCTRGQAAGVLR